jgi:hypothetical protein
MPKSDHVPKRSREDIVHSAAKALIGSVPYAGNAAAEFFQILVQPSLERRRDEWMNDVADRLKKLEEEGLTIEKLQAKEQFVSALMQATQISMRTHQKEKREALRNAVINSAKPNPPDEAMQQMFLAFVDNFTEWHIRLLKLFNAPPPVPGLSMGGLSTVLEHYYPEVRGRREFYDQVWRDLYIRGLVIGEHMHGTVSGRGLTQQQTTQMGAAFIKFITE